jgi:hypothetical protein
MVTKLFCVTIETHERPCEIFADLAAA